MAKNIKLRAKRSIKKILVDSGQYNLNDLKKLFFEYIHIFKLSGMGVLTKHDHDDLYDMRTEKRDKIIEEFKDIINKFLKEDFDFNARRFEKLVHVIEEELKSKIEWADNPEKEEAKYEAVMEIIKQNKYNMTITDLDWLDIDKDIKILDTRFEQDANPMSRILTSTTIYDIEVKFRDLGTKQTKVDFTEADRCYT